jgi:hypothetical protein
MAYRTSYRWYIKLPAYGILFDPQTHGIPNPIPMVYQTACLWYFVCPHKLIVYRTPYPWYIKLPAYGILLHPPKRMVYRTTCLWYFCLNPRTHGISNHLPIVFCLNPELMVYRTPYSWYIEPSTYFILLEPPNS